MAESYFSINSENGKTVMAESYFIINSEVGRL